MYILVLLMNILKVSKGVIKNTDLRTLINIYTSISQRIIIIFEIILKYILCLVSFKI